MRKLEIDILIIFSALLAVSTAAIITFTYFRDHASLLRLARVTTHDSSELLRDKIENLFVDLEQATHVTAGIVARHSELSFANEDLVAYLLSEISFRGVHDGIHIANEEGDYLASLAKEDGYLLASISGKEETRRLYDKNLVEISTRTELLKNYDPRKRVWYKGAVDAKGEFWSDLTPLHLLKEPGVSVSVPVYREERLVAVVGAFLSLNRFSHLITEQKIGKNGAAFILNQQGVQILPTDVSPYHDIVTPAFQKGGDEQILDVHGVKYLIAIEEFPLKIGEAWKIMTIVPFNDYFEDLESTQKQVVLISLIIWVIASLLIIFFSKHISRPIVALSHQLDRLRRLDFQEDEVIHTQVTEIAMLNQAVIAVRSALSSFVRYVPKEIVRKLLDKSEEMKLGGEKRVATLLFSDITDLSPIADALPLEDLNQLLIEYFDGVSKSILETGGMIDKYIGDGVLAFWNVPDDLNDHVYQGCVAALHCRDFVKEFNRKQKEKNKPELWTRIGVNSGPVIAGNVGTEERMNYTVIGSVVNLTQRFEQLNKTYRTNIIIGEAVLAQVSDRILVRPLDITSVKGIRGKTKLYELLSLLPGASYEEKAFAEEFTAAFNAYHEGGLQTAKDLFEAFLAKYPNDYPASLYLSRLKK